MNTCLWCDAPIAAGQQLCPKCWTINAEIDEYNRPERRAACWETLQALRAYKAELQSKVDKAQACYDKFNGRAWGRRFDQARLDAARHLETVQARTNRIVGLCA